MPTRNTRLKTSLGMFAAWSAMLGIPAPAYAQSGIAIEQTYEEEVRRREAERRREARQQDPADDDRDASGPASRPIDLQRYSRLAGIHVESEDNQKIGVIANMAIDLESATPVFLVVNTQGAQERATGAIVAPLAAVRFTPNGTVAKLGVSRQRLLDAPAFDTSGWATINDARWSRIVHEFYGVEAPDDAEQRRLVKASDVMGARCVARGAQGNSGTCEDLLIDFRRRTVPLTVLVLESGNAGEERTVAVPTTLLALRSNDNVLSVNADSERLASSPRFSFERDLTSINRMRETYAHFNVSSPNVYGFVKPDNARRPERSDGDDDDNGNGNDNDSDDDERVDDRRLSQPAAAADLGWQARSEYGRQFDSNAVTTVSGRVVRIERFSPGSQMSDGVRLILRNDDQQTVDVHLGPAWFVERQQGQFKQGDDVRVTGARVAQTGQRPRFIIASEVQRGDAVLVLRNREGQPLWDGWRNSRD